MKIFIIGGSGLMGPHLVKEIELLGHQVSCLNRRGIFPGRGRAIKGDRNDERGLRSAILESDPDLIIDMIPYTEEQAFALCRIIEEIKKPLIACSSIDVYRAYNIIHRLEKPPYQACPIKEFDELRSVPGTEGKSYDKLNVERRYLSLNVDVTIFRLPAIYGWPDQRCVKGYVDQIKDTGQVTMHPHEASWRCSRALNENCAYAISLGVGQSGKSIYNVGEASSYTQAEWCRKIGDHINWDREIVLSETENCGGDAKQDWVVDTRLIREDLGYHEKYDCDDGLGRNIVEYLKSEQAASVNGDKPRG